MMQMGGGRAARVSSRKPEGDDLVCRREVGWIWEHKWSTREKGECACIDADDQEGMCGGGRPFLPASVFLKVIR